MPRTPMDPEIRKRRASVARQKVWEDRGPEAAKRQAQLMNEGKRRYVIEAINAERKRWADIVDPDRKLPAAELLELVDRKIAEAAVLDEQQRRRQTWERYRARQKAEAAEQQNGNEPAA